MYLLDTNVVSELRRPRPDPGVIEWLSRIPANELFPSAVTLGELQIGVENAKNRDPARAAVIEVWVDTVANGYQVLPMEGRTFRRWAQLMQGQPADLFADAMIAATALVHGLRVVSRNTRDFERLGLEALNPFAGDQTR